MCCFHVTEVDDAVRVERQGLYCFNKMLAFPQNCSVTQATQAELWIHYGEEGEQLGANNIRT